MTVTHETAPANQDLLFDTSDNSRDDSAQITPAIVEQYPGLRDLNRPEQVEDIISKLPNDVRLAIQQALSSVSEYTRIQSSRMPRDIEKQKQRKVGINAAHTAAIEALGRLYGSDAAPYWLNIYINHGATLGRMLAPEQEQPDNPIAVERLVGGAATNLSRYSDGAMRAAEGSARSPWNQD